MVNEVICKYLWFGRCFQLVSRSVEILIVLFFFRFVLIIYDCRRRFKCFIFCLFFIFVLCLFYVCFYICFYIVCNLIFILYYYLVYQLFEILLIFIQSCYIVNDIIDCIIEIGFIVYCKVYLQVNEGVNYELWYYVYEY